MGDDEAAKQDDFIAFDMDEELVDQLDGPVPTSSVAAHGAGTGSRTPAARQQYNTHSRGETGGPANRRGPHNDPRNVHSEPRFRKPEIKSLDVLTPLPIPPWQPKDRKYSKNLLKMLHEEIDDYISYLIPTEAEHAMRRLTIDRITNVVHTVRPKADVRVFGSFETKLYLPSSDVDVVILDKTMHLPPIRQVEEAIRKAGIASKIECITGAKVPIIKIIDSITGYPADISFNVAAGVHAAEIVKTFLDDPRCGEGLRPLLLIMKQFLLQRNLNEVFTGGMGSYTLMSIIAAFLRMHPRLQTGQIQAKDNLGVLLIELLEFYGVNFNYEVVGIAMDMEGVWYFPKSAISPPNVCPLQRGPPRYDALCVIDPQDQTNEIAGATKGWRIIRSEFARAAQLLIAMLGAGYQHPSRSTHVTTLLGSILTVRRETIEHRESVQEKWEEIRGRVGEYTLGVESDFTARNGNGNGAASSSSSSPGKQQQQQQQQQHHHQRPNSATKRKRGYDKFDSSADDEHIYVSGTSEDEAGGGGGGKERGSDAESDQDYLNELAGKGSAGGTGRRGRGGGHNGAQGRVVHVAKRGRRGR
ncbi:uncharacterized protein EV422DRAFT_598553 [Fimicolochytrium jonesii]|uniref:uncharacterized protein n=1 Tax=Fimicolochytrium jonesii TaxID=1396493 RepID=UPI0022FE829E|nr:uncharacterized protein EV422DRAFT_598553 [Fimicolochytrium jonesii]KAI8819755.1 hypothetical protein EV422DRAFT_598553 [Fimicolochytrium jonesii]